MSGKRETTRAAVVALLVIGGIVGAIGLAKMLGYDPTAAGPRSPLVGRPAPELELPMVSGEGAGESDRISLSALRGEVVLLDFWASWCSPCRHSIPILNEIHDRYQGRVELLGVNVESGMPAERVRAAHADFGARFPSLQDQGFAAQSAYQVQSIPTLVLIGRDGVVRWVEHGVPDADEVTDRLDSALQR